MSARKIVILGSDGSGKTCIAKQFKSQTFDDKQEPGVEEKFTDRITLDGKEIEVEINDTNGADTQATVVRELLMKQGDGFMVVYSITSQQSFNDTKAVVDKLYETRGTKQVPILLVGNKLDLEANREVLTPDGEDYSKQLSCPFMEISASERQNVVDAFTRLLQEIEHPAAPDVPAEGGDQKPKKGCCTIL